MDVLKILKTFERCDDYPTCSKCPINNEHCNTRSMTKLAITEIERLRSELAALRQIMASGTEAWAVFGPDGFELGSLDYEKREACLWAEGYEDDEWEKLVLKGYTARPVVIIEKETKS